MSRFTRLLLAHRWLVVLPWLLITAGGVGAVGHIGDRLDPDFSLPGRPGYEATEQMVRAYGNGGEQPPLIVVLTSATPIGPGATAAAFSALQRAVPAVRVVDEATTGGEGFASADRRTVWALVFVRSGGFGGMDTGTVQQAAATVAGPGTQSRVTGLDVLAQGGEVDGPGVLVEALLGALGALAVLAFVFGSLLALVPLLIAGVSIMATFLSLLGLTYLTEVNPLVEFLIALVGLGVAIDYSLLVVTRWREERQRGSDNHSAVVTAMNTAGRAAAFSGLTVAIGLLSLVVLPVPFLRSIGYAGMLIPLASVAATVTLLPVLLGSAGPRLDWPRIRRDDRPSRIWTAWTRKVVRHRIAATVGALALLAALASPLAGIQLGQAPSGSLATSGAGYDALVALQQAGAPAGLLTPIEILTHGDPAPAREAVGRVAGISQVTISPPRNGYVDVIALPDHETVSASTVDIVDRVRDAVRPVPGVVGVTGVGAMHLDFRTAVYGNIPLVLAVLLGAMLVLLTMVFRSIVLPIKAVLLNLLSLAATYGAVVLFWQYGYGSEALYDIPATGAITFWIPAMVFAFLFGLSMDYEVFILARIREEYDRTGFTRQAVVSGMARTGRLVTSAALILFLAFVAMSSGPATEVKMFATALGIGILLDATVVRALLVPAVIAAFGRWNWWLPGSRPAATASPSEPRSPLRV